MCGVVMVQYIHVLKYHIFSERAYNRIGQECTTLCNRGKISTPLTPSLLFAVSSVSWIRVVNTVFVFGFRRLGSGPDER